jgi:hypothetical protein
LRTYEHERSLIARETHEESRKDLAKMLDQIAMERAVRLPPPIPQPSLEEQIRESIRKIREDVQRTQDAQTAHILRWLQS